MALDGLETLMRLLAEAVLNGLWQGLLLTALIWLGLRLAAQTSAATRFGIWWATLGVMLALPLVHLAMASPDTTAPVARAAPIHLSARWPLLLVAAWAVGAALLLGRLVWSYGYVHWLEHTSSPLDGSWQRRTARVTGSDLVTVRGSHETPVPVVIGLRRPSILIPHSLLARLTAAEIDQILLHEWAHIRRRDQWTNYLLEFAQALYFFHPAVWWIGRALRLEREIACDDSVVRATGAPIRYAGCLAKLVELNSCPPVSLSPGAVGDGRDLFQRVERLLAWSGGDGFSALRFAAASVVLLGAAAFSGQMPDLIDIPAPALAIRAPHPAIEASRRAIVAEERIRHAGILMETAAARMASADRLLRSAKQQMRLAVRIAESSAASPLSRVVCQQPAAAPAEPKLNKI
jgi:beta-lactamase regulating signal transducer with metallopeptidase domain